MQDADARWPGSLRHALARLGGEARDHEIRQAAWVARCVGRGASAPLAAADIAALADSLQIRSLAPGQVLFASGEQASAVWIVRAGQVELSIGSGRRRVVVGVLRPGDVDGDIAVLLEMPPPYTARALDDTTCLQLDAATFDHLLATRAAIGRRWVSSVAQRLAASQARILNLLGRSLPQQAAALIRDEVSDGQVHLPQRTLAAMLGVQRPSLNKILKDFELRGLIALSYATIDVLDPAGLAAVADRP